MSTLTWITDGSRHVLSWLVSRLSPAQWETWSLVMNRDDMVCLQESLADCQYRRLVSMRQSFDDL